MAPGKVILFGEHAINRGQPAIAAAIGLYTRCKATSVSRDDRMVLPRTEGEGRGEGEQGIRFRSGDRFVTAGRDSILALG